MSTDISLLIAAHNISMFFFLEKIEVSIIMKIFEIDVI